MSKSRKKIPEKIIKALCSSSKGICQNPDCANSVMDGDNFIGEHAHIVAYNKGGSRGKDGQEEDNSFENLLVLCPTCHTKVDKAPELYPSEILRKWKKNFQIDIKGSKQYNREWDSISHYTNKNLQPSLVLNGRDEQIKKLKNILIEDGRKILIKSDGLLESYFFILSVFHTHSGVGKNIRFIDNQSAWEDILGVKEKLILIPSHNFVPRDIGIAITKGHNVILYAGKETIYTNGFDKEIELERMGREDRVSALTDILGDNDNANKIYSDTKGYFYPILRHKLMEFNEQMIPGWVDSTDHIIFTTIFLLSEWEEEKNKSFEEPQKAEDIELVEMLSGMNYENFKKELEILSRKEDSPIRYIAKTWQVVSKSDMWTYVERHIHSSTLEKFAVVCKEVFVDKDESYDLPKEQRWYAALYGKGTKYSQRLRSGISDSFLLVSVLGDENMQDPLKKILRDTLDSEINASKLLNSLGRNLENLAEAYPELFLEYIRKHIDSLHMVFDIADSMFSGSGAYTSLLWAMEKISLNKDYAVDVIDILFDLTRKYDSNIPDNHSNRPMGTLVEIFIPWLCHTPLEIQERLDILDRVKKEYPDETFKLIIKLLNSQTSMNIALPQYQNWYQEFEHTVTNIEYRDYLIGLINILLDIFTDDIENKAIDIIRNYTKFTPEQVRKVIEIFKNHSFSKEGYIKIVPEIQEEIERDLYGIKVYEHTSVLTHDVKLQDEVLELYKSLQNRDIILGNISLFNDERKILLEQLNKYEKGDYDKERETADEKRKEVIKEIYKQKGFEGILELNGYLNKQYILAKAIVESGLINDILDESLSLLEQEEKDYLGITIISQLEFLEKGKDEGLIKEITSTYSERSENFQVNFLLGLWVNQKTIQLLKSSNERVRERYWKSLEGFRHYRFLQEDAYDKIDYVITELNKYGLYGIAFEQVEMGMSDKKDININPQLVIETLEGLVGYINSGKHVSSLEYYLKEVMKFLYKELEKGNLTSKEVFNIEMMYLKAIDEPRLINDELSKNPESFVTMIKNSFKAKHRKVEEETSENQKKIASNSYEILKKFSLVPGTQEDGSIDQKELMEWLDKSFELLKESDRFEIGSQKIGELFINTPQGKDGIHPCETIRNIFEHYKNDDLERGYDVGKINSRGVTMRGIHDGGKQERELAEKYKEDSEKIISKWSRTGKLLKRISEDYYRQAKQEDERLELDKI